MSSTLLQTAAVDSIPLSNHNPNTDRQLLIRSRKYAVETRSTSWWHLLSTILVLTALVAVTGWGSHWAVRCAGSLLIGLTFVRMFVMYHDYLHHAIFKDSLVAGLTLKLFGHLMLTSHNVWKRSHDHHHRNNSKMFGASIGSFPVMTTASYRAAGKLQKFEYRIARSPMIIVCGYLTVFLFGMCIYPLICDFRRNAGAIAAILLHFGLTALCVATYGWLFAFLVFLGPSWLAMAAGSYLFYIQHNFPQAKIRCCSEWTYTEAALESSSYLETGSLLRWFTGNIGYHHIHHLNAKIPFYRLPEAMRGCKELQHPGRTSLRIREIMRCLKLKLWDVERDQFVPFG
jgi:acyl-lipid omega-6 desaturase (Delta-12 desaturase)